MEEEYIFPQRYSTKINLNFGLCQDVCRCSHVEKEICHREVHQPMALSNANRKLPFSTEMKRLRTMHSGFGSSCSQEPHPSDHEILEGPVRDLAPFTHILRKTRDFGGWIRITLERTLKGRCLVIFSRRPFHDIGFSSSLRREECSWQGWQSLPRT